MLYFETIEPDTLDLLNRLMALPELEEFILVGGTALSLRYGHRKSIDLDLFSKNEFDNQQLKDLLTKYFDNFQSSGSNTAPGVFAYFGEIKVDFVKYHYHKIIRPVEISKAIRIMSSEDIAAMKIFAILQRARKKDFWDISLLLDKFGLDKIMKYYFEKFPQNQTLITIPQALLYFDDAENDEDPVSLQKQTWGNIKKNIQNHVNNFLK
jgi:predicted nucleotidyltransferase component of viral defense system